MTRSTTLLLLSAVGWTVSYYGSGVDGFQSVGRRATLSPASRTQSSSSLRALSPEHATQLAQDIHATIQMHLPHALTDGASSTTLADAAAAVLAPPGADGGSLADAVVEQISNVDVEVPQEVVDAVEMADTSDKGWWMSYIDIFKNALETVHDTIDGPLRSAGITQTWGVSIAVFTACKLRTLLKRISLRDCCQ